MSEEYIKGYKQGVRDFAKRVKNYYHHLTGKTMTDVVEYVIDLMCKETTEEVEKDE